MPQGVWGPSAILAAALSAAPAAAQDPSPPPDAATPKPRPPAPIGPAAPPPRAEGTPGPFDSRAPAQGKPSPSPSPPPPLSASPPTAATPDDAIPLEFRWKDGLEARSADGRMVVRVGGLIQLDAAFAQEDRDIARQVTPLPDTAGVRRAVLAASGEWAPEVAYRFGWDSAQGGALEDAWIGYATRRAWIRVGHQYEPCGLTQLTPDDAGAFLERPPVAALIPDRNAGLCWTSVDPAADHPGGRISTSSVGIFRTTDRLGSASGDGEWALTIRFSEVRDFLTEHVRVHWGVWTSLRTTANGAVRMQVRPVSALFPPLADTLFLLARHVFVTGLEAAVAWGPVFAEAQAVGALVNVRTGTSPWFTGYDVAIGTFLTGDRRPYDKSRGAFDRPRPEWPLRDGGAGAVAVAARFGWLDLNSGTVQAGRVQEATLGLDWWPTATVRATANVGYVHLLGVGEAVVLGLRLQLRI